MVKFRRRRGPARHRRRRVRRLPAGEGRGRPRAHGQRSRLDGRAAGVAAGRAGNRAGFAWPRSRSRARCRATTSPACSRRRHPRAAVGPALYVSAGEDPIEEALARAPLAAPPLHATRPTAMDMAEAEQPDRLARRATIGDIRQLTAGFDPAFRIDLRARIARLIVCCPTTTRSRRTAGNNARCSSSWHSGASSAVNRRASIRRPLPTRCASVGAPMSVGIPT